MLKDIVIRSMSSDAAYEQGCRLYSSARVFCQQAGKNPPVYEGKVRDAADGVSYSVNVRLSQDGSNVDRYHCHCQESKRYLGACRHTVALMKAIIDLQDEEVNESGSRLFALFRASVEKPAGAPQPVYLLPRLQVQQEYGKVTKWLEFRLNYGRNYVLQNLQDFLRTVKRGEPWTLGRTAMLDTRRMVFADAASRALWDMMKEAWEAEASLLSYSASFQYYHALNKSYIFDHKAFKLTPANFRQFLSIMDETSFDMRVDGDEVGDVHVVHGNPELDVAVEERDGGGRLVLRSEPVIALDDAYRYFYQGDAIYAADEAFSRRAKPLLQAFVHTSRIRLNQSDMARFFGEVLPAVEDAADVAVDRKFREQFLLVPLAVELYIDYYKDGIAVKPVFRYDELTFNPLREAPQPPADRQLIRDSRREAEVQNLFLTYGFVAKNDQFVQPDEDKTYAFLTEGIASLPENIAVFYADAIQSRPVRPMPRIEMGVSINDMNLLEITFDTRNLDINELMDILASYRQKRRYHRLKDGTFLTLGDQQLAAVSDFAEKAGVRAENLKDGKAELPLSRAMYLDELAAEDERLHLERSAKFRSIVHEVEHPGLLHVEVPKSLRGVLRSYQVTGFNWLSTLSAYHFGGILADDMGLGKTLQVMAFLLAQKERAQQAGENMAPSLVVAPTSLVYNWFAEIQRFTPGLQAVVVAGTKKERSEGLEQAFAVHADVILTTYNMLKRDIGSYEARVFHYVFLDEAQHIKNPETQNARAVKKLHADGWFALTGTPIENTLTELWSIFDFLMPGYLGTHRQFKQHYEIPIVREREKEKGTGSEAEEHAQRALIDLRRRIHPFILRRLKRDVLTELPDKVERVLVNEMTAKQAKVYQAYFLQSQKKFAKMLKEHGLGESHIQVLAILTRLRQIACDPSLFLESWEGGSGKLDQLEEIVLDAIESGHRMLIFSQFTQMLARIRQRLTARRVPCSYLDGSTSALERMELVESFNQGTIPVFLISLKAGGTGLNLTGADMVIHFDPWWNPAVEDQATDRAYRLGQQRNVQVVKLITKDTVEEKIYALQEKKKSMIDQMIQPGGSFLSKLSDEEIRSLFHWEQYAGNRR